PHLPPASEIRAEPLDGQPAFEQRVDTLLPDAHPAGAQFRQNLILPTDDQGVTSLVTRVSGDGDASSSRSTSTGAADRLSVAPQRSASSISSELALPILPVPAIS